MKLHILFTSIFIGLVGCNTKRDQSSKQLTNTIDDFAALPKVAPHPISNPYSPEKAALGKLLFFDPILSGHKDVSCATCHHPEFGFSESLEVSIGVNGQGLGQQRNFKTPNTIPLVKRNAHTILNTAFNGIAIKTAYDPNQAPMFWDNRVSSLEEQALQPIMSFEEMRGYAYSKESALEIVCKRLDSIQAYHQQFKQVFASTTQISPQMVAMAIACYERTLIAPNSRFDAYLWGDNTALSSLEKEGLNAFLKAGCAQCHNGPMLSDYKLHTLGVAENNRLPKIDSGATNTFAFRTPSLRNLRFTAPYMHNGVKHTIKEVLEFYEDLSGDKPSENKAIKSSMRDPLVENIDLEFKDIRIIEEFLNSLNDPNFDHSQPLSVPSGLPVGGAIKL